MRSRSSSMPRNSLQNGNGSTAASNNSRSTTTTTGTTALSIACMVVVSSFIHYCTTSMTIQKVMSPQEEVYNGWWTTACCCCVMILVPLSLLFIMAGSKYGHECEYTLCIFPMGVQVSMLQPAPAPNANNNNNTPPVALPRVTTFLSRYDILDCVVNEQILAHRVRNCLLFRLRNLHELVEPFPQLDLTYRECLSLRKSIMAALSDYGILQQHPLAQVTFDDGK